MSIDYSSLGTQELGLIIAEAQTAIKAKREQEKDEVRSEILTLAESRGYSIDELFPTGGKGKKKPAATHRDPGNPGNTWTGRGRKPKWLLEALDAGRTIEEFVIS